MSSLRFSDVPRMFDIRTRGLQPLHLPFAPRVWRCRVNANVPAFWQCDQLQGLHWSCYKPEQMFRYMPHASCLQTVWLIMPSLLQVLFHLIIPPALKRPFKPWMASRLAWKDWKFNWSGQRMPADPINNRSSSNAIHNNYNIQLGHQHQHPATQNQQLCQTLQPFPLQLQYQPPPQLQLQRQQPTQLSQCLQHQQHRALTTQAASCRR